MTPLSLLLFCLPVVQDPAPPEPASQTEPASRLDVIELKNGERFEGRITTEIDGYVEFQLDHGAMVGIARNRIKAVRRGAGAEIAAVAVALDPRDEWFVLHDATGASVGWLHATVAIAGDGTVTASEEYEFGDGSRRIQVTSICTANSELAPQRCYYRERRSEPVHGIVAPTVGGGTAQPDRIVDERIVEARCQGDTLNVSRADGSGRHERQHDWSEGATFPLLARVLARNSGMEIAKGEMFDPATEEITLRGIAGARPRAVVLDGKHRRVTEIVESGTPVANAEWLDASMKTLRREIAGPALVAVPSNASDVRAKVGRATIPAALARETEGAFGLWVPNPFWLVETDLAPGQVVLACEAHGASIGLVRVDHLTPGTQLGAAADAVANWFHLMHPGLKIERREWTRARDRRAIRLVAAGRLAAVPMQATVDVVPHGDHYFVLTCRAPARSWAELAGDFAFALDHVEFTPEAVEPPQQGPLRRR